MAVPMAWLLATCKESSMHFTASTWWTKRTSSTISFGSSPAAIRKTPFDPKNEAAWKTLAARDLQSVSGQYHMGLTVFGASNSPPLGRNMARLAPFHSSLIYVCGKGTTEDITLPTGIQYHTKMHARNPCAWGSG